MKTSRIFAAFLFMYCPCALYMILTAPNAPTLALVIFSIMILIVMFFAGKILVNKY